MPPCPPGRQCYTMIPFLKERVEKNDIFTAVEWLSEKYRPKEPKQNNELFYFIPGKLSRKLMKTYDHESGLYAYRTFNCIKRFQFNSKNPEDMRLQIKVEQGETDLYTEEQGMTRDLD